ncbi:MAG: hypothetical protein ABSE68_02220 [Minisyncoccia bacterium]
MSAKRILIIDDDEALRVVLSAELEEEGYQVDSAPNLKEGLAKLTKIQFDMAIVEPFKRTGGIRDDDVETRNFLQKFADKPRPCPYLLVLTGFADLKNAIDCLKKYGANDFVSKPYDLVDFLTTIERIFDDRSSVL